MPNYTQGYERNTQSSKFYSSSVVGHKGYNPIVTHYYGSDNKIVRVEELFSDVLYSQTISGSNYVEQWPDYTYTITYNAWEETTVS